MRERGDYTFFWTTSHINGWASQWYAAPFTATVKVGDEERSIKFTSAEQWMMVQKALLFSDLDIAEATVAIESTGRGAMAQVKALGRKVTGFDEKIWKAEREKIVLQGNLHKFRQNEELKQKLLDTGDKVLVEASPGDSIWGIGYSEQKALENRDSWGLNLLGKALVETRRILREEMVNGT